jgi:predicted NBD/HSP70 family sugar kinase
MEKAVRRTTMTYYAVLDVSLKEVSICVIDDDGEVVAQGTAPADPEVNFVPETGQFSY